MPCPKLGLRFGDPLMSKRFRKVEYVTGRDRDEGVRVRAADHPALAPSWRDRFAAT